MFAKLTTPQRIQIGLVLAMVFLLVLGSSKLDQRHFSTVQNTVNSVFKDRVVVQNLIYQMSTIFYTKELRFIRKDNFESVLSENQKVEQLLIDFRATKLTPNESNLLYQLNSRFTKLRVLEEKIVRAPDEAMDNTTILAIKSLKNIKENLNGLAKIQLDESGQLTQLSNKTLGTHILLSKLEVGFLVIIGIAMLALIFYPLKTTRTAPERNAEKRFS